MMVVAVSLLSGVVLYFGLAFWEWYGPYKEDPGSGCASLLGSQPYAAEVVSSRANWRWMPPEWRCEYRLRDSSVEMESLSEAYGAP